MGLFIAREILEITGIGIKESVNRAKAPASISLFRKKNTGFELNEDNVRKTGKIAMKKFRWISSPP